MSARSSAARFAVAAALAAVALLAFGSSGCRGPAAGRGLRVPLPKETDRVSLSEAAQRWELGPATPVDAELQAAIADADARIAAELGIAAEQRAFGVVDLAGPRLALLNGDRMFYGASVPKIAIVLGYFASRPRAVDELDIATLVELQRVIKLSDNDLAAKYSRLVGLDYLQELLQSPRLALYDREHGGGLWCGKHYGQDAPRRGDPLADHSHAATVRQCLRYYLLMEQNRLIDARVCARLRQVFAAPQLDFHDDNFVRGLRGRPATLLRKNGLWEDWHLDTARVQHGDRVYLLAGMVKHSRGPEYLAKMAAAADDLLCGPAIQPPPYWHETILHDRPEAFEGGPPLVRADGVHLHTTPAAPRPEFTSPIVACSSFFNEALLSWNADVPAGAGCWFELRVGRSWDDSWSPWLYVGDWGAAPTDVSRVVAFDGGRIDVDYFRSEQRFDRAQYRVTACSDKSDADVRVERVALCFSDLSGIPLAQPRTAQRIVACATPGVPVVAPAYDATALRRLPVPFRSQKTQRPEIAGRICSPTSLAMVLEYRGATHETLAVAEACYDATHQIYGNWPRNVQAAYALGVRGFLTRIGDWETAERLIAGGCPLIISIRVERPGDLRGAPYNTTDGHLIVLCGFDAEGNAEVNDPAAGDAATGVLRYSRGDLERCWMRGSGGVAYVLDGAAPPVAPVAR